MNKVHQRSFDHMWEGKHFPLLILVEMDNVIMSMSES